MSTTTSNILHEDEQPINKFLYNGMGMLSDVEVIAEVIGTGKNKKWHDAAQRIVAKAGSLTNIAKLKHQEIAEAGQISQYRAMKLVFAIELWKRSDPRANEAASTEIRRSRDLYDMLYPKFVGLQVEEFWVVYMTKKNKVIRAEMVSRGGTDMCMADSKVIFKMSILAGASAIIVAHNHPSGTLRPSQQDMDITKKLKTVGDMCGIPVIDHIIMTDNGYYSFLDEGFI
jgi:DNA repair protein RadC